LSRRPGDSGRDSSPLLEPDELTLELRTLRTTIPMRRPAACPATLGNAETSLCRTTVLRSPAAGARPPCHPDAILAARERMTRRRRGLAVVVALLVVPLALQLVKALRTIRPTPAQDAIAVPLAPRSAPTNIAPFANAAPSRAPSAAPQPMRRTPGPGKPRRATDIIDPWGG
jgi:hypothetical protein